MEIKTMVEYIRPWFLLAILQEINGISCLKKVQNHHKRFERRGITGEYTIICAKSVEWHN